MGTVPNYILPSSPSGCLSKNRVWNLLLVTGSAILVISCARPGKLVLLHQVTGPVKTNCYLVYDATENEAALIDVAGPVDSLVAHMQENDLQLKYVFVTHGHMDHCEGIPMILKQFPNVLLCCSQADYGDFVVSWQLVKEHDPEMISKLKSSPEFSKWLEYEMPLFREPDVYLDDNQAYQLGNLTIRTILTPGHSRGSICLYVDDVLFAGDVLFYRRVGGPAGPGGSEEDIIQSVRRLYAMFPDSTKVYPGHGEFTDIGSEKRENSEVTLESAAVQN